MSEDANTELKPDTEKGKTSVPITNKELANRVRQANQQFEVLDDKQENFPSALGNLAEFFNLKRVRIVPDKDPQKEGFGKPTSGNIRLMNYDSVLPKEILINLFSLKEKLPQKLAQIEKMLEKQGIAFAHIFDSSTEDDEFLTEDEMSVNIALGEGASKQWLEKHIDRPEKLDLEMLDKKLKQKQCIYIKIDSITRKNWKNAVPIMEERTDDDNSQIEYGFGPDIFINIPYTPAKDIDLAVQQLNALFSALSEIGIFNLSEPVNLTIAFHGEMQSQEPYKAPLSSKAYQLAIEKIQGQEDERSSSRNPYVNFFHKDLQIVPFLSYEEAVRATKLIDPELAKQTIITRKEICEVIQTDSGKYEVLLPKSEYGPLDPFNPDYRSIFHHSRINETWTEERSSYLPENQDIKKQIRGYILELAGGKRLLLSNAPLDKEMQILKSLDKGYGIEIFNIQSEQAFNKATLLDQLNQQIELDVSMLKDLNIPARDRKLYKYWMTRILLKKDPQSLEELSGDLSDKLEEMQQILYRQRQKNKKASSLNSSKS